MKIPSCRGLTVTFKTGDKVRHRAMNELGVVQGIDPIDGTVTVVYETTKGLGRITGIYDRRWFQIYPRELVPADSNLI